MKTKRQSAIFSIILENEPIGISTILEKLNGQISVPTLNRDLAALKAGNFILPEGRGPGIKYTLNRKGLLKAAIDPDTFFKTDIDNRKILERFNPFIFDSLNSVPLFSTKETEQLEASTELYRNKLKQSDPIHYKREFERLMIELSWKSSQIEGNTYDLLDTEQLLKYNIEAPNHSTEEAQMLLNHKSAIEYTRDYAEIFSTLSVSKIIDIHTLLTKNMGIAKTIRSRLVRITGTKYMPPDNQFIIEEALEKLCSGVNSNTSTYEKALLTVLMISYIQPFDDGNKRTARLSGNALLMGAGLSPLSYRSVSPAEYKKAILLFYELNNITAFKKIFIAQYQFAVENYF
jgi:Fic family protein